MDSTEGGEEPRDARGNLLNQTWSRIIDYGKRKFNERRARREKETPTERAGRRTANATWFIALLTLVIVGVGVSQWNIQSGTLDEMRDEQRPWLRGAAKLAGPLTNDKGSLSIEAGLDINNIGHRPATEVRAKAAIIHYKTTKLGTTGDILKTVCNSAPDSLWTFFGDPTGGADIIFPGEPDSLEVTASDVDQTDTREKISESKAFEIKGFSHTDPDTVYFGDSLILIYCVAYKYSDTSAFHHTGSTMQVIFINGATQIRTGQNIPASDMKLQRPPFEWRNFAD